MDTIISLEWKDYSVDLKRILCHLKSNLSENFDGIVANDETLRIIFLTTISQEDIDIVNDYWSSITEETFSEPEPQTSEQIARQNMYFGQSIITEFTTESEVMALDAENITQLITMMTPVQIMLFTGALQPALTNLQNTDYTSILSQELVDKYIEKLSTYLGT